MYTKNFVRERIRDGQLVDVSAQARERGYANGMALSHAAAALGAEAVVETVLEFLARQPVDAGGLFQMVPFHADHAPCMLVIESFGQAVDNVDTSASLWAVVDLA